MLKTIMGVVVLLSLSACGDYDGRKTNCWSAPAFAESTDIVSRGCADWTMIGAEG